MRRSMPMLEQFQVTSRPVRRCPWWCSARPGGSLSDAPAGWRCRHGSRTSRPSSGASSSPIRPCHPIRSGPTS